MEKPLIFTYVKFSVEKCGVLVKGAAELNWVSDIKRDIHNLEFGTVLLRLNWSNLQPKYLCTILTAINRLSYGSKA